jgi:hypothetical protein
MHKKEKLEATITYSSGMRGQICAYVALSGNIGNSDDDAYIKMIFTMLADVKVAECIIDVHKATIINSGGLCILEKQVPKKKFIKKIIGFNDFWTSVLTETRSPLAKLI